MIETNIISSPAGQISISCNSDDKSVLPNFRNHYYENYIQNILSKYVINKTNVLDIGANFGQHTVLMSKLNPEGKVYAVEASKENYDFLCTNIKQNNCDNVIPLNNFLSNTIKQVDYYYVPEVAACSFGCTTNYGEERHKENHSQVITETLDNLFPYTDFDLIKLDVEGAELDILKGGSKVFNNLPKLIIELNSYTTENMYGQKIDLTIDKLKELGYTQTYVIAAATNSRNIIEQSVTFNQLKNLFTKYTLIDVLFN